MRRLILLACLVPRVAMVASAQDVDPKRLPAVKRALDKAEATILRNRKAYHEANEKALAEAEKELLKEVDRLSKAGKPEEAVAVKRLATGFRDQAIASAEKKVAPPNPFQVGAVSWNGHKYKVFPEQCSWHEAKKKCEDAGGHLVIVNDKKEQAFVVALLGRSGMPVDNRRNGTYAGVWLGATDEAKEGEWRCVDGTALAYENWSAVPTKEPNGGPGSHYLALGIHFGGDWDDRASTDRNIACICEWDE